MLCSGRKPCLGSPEIWQQKLLTELVAQSCICRPDFEIIKHIVSVGNFAGITTVQEDSAQEKISWLFTSAPWMKGFSEDHNFYKVLTDRIAVTHLEIVG